MKLEFTLYKDCILNETYKNVFSLAKRNDKTILELYLEKLTKYIFECNDVYYENSGEFVFDYNLIDENIKRTIYEFNYLKIREFDNDDNLSLVRYCFIDKIFIKNDVVYLSYKEDIWHSYIDKAKGINESYMSRTRYRSRLYLDEPIELPVEYDGNNELSISEEIYNSLLYCLIEVQVYEQVSADEPRAYRDVKYYIVKGNGSTGYKQLATEIETLITDLEIFMTDQLLGGYNYEIGDVYIVNADFDLENKLSFGTEIQLGSTGIYFKPLSRNANSFKGIKLVEKTILNDYKNYSIGTFDHQVKLINNGTSFTVSVYMFYSNGNIVFQMRLLNQIIDITNSFKYEIPVSSIRAEEFTQRKINLNLEKQNLNIDLDEGKFWSGWFGNMIGFVEGIVKGKYSKGYREFVGGMYETPFFDRQKLGNKLDAITAPQYSNSKGTFGNNSGICNYRQGIFILKINPDNADYVKYSINNKGYKIYHYTRDINNLNLFTDMYSTIHYDYQKFELMDIYGSFPREIASALNDIFENGVKIWYDENLYYDTYVN